MDKALQVFNYNGKRVRAVERNGDVWLVAKDICKVLGISKYRDVISRLDEDERMSTKLDTLGGVQTMTVINEPGLYRLAFRSNKPEAKAFARWVTHEVLPQIRQHGMYLTDKAAELAASNPKAFDELLERYVKECKKTQELEAKLASERAFTTLGHVVLALPGSMTVQAAAHFLAQYGFEVGQNRLYKKCREEGYLCKRKGRQYNQPTQRAIEQGLFNSEVSGGFRPIAMVTPKGLSLLTEKLASESYPLLLLIEGKEGETEQE